MSWRVKSYVLHRFYRQFLKNKPACGAEFCKKSLATATFWKFDSQVWSRNVALVRTPSTFPEVVEFIGNQQKSKICTRHWLGAHFCIHQNWSNPKVMLWQWSRTHFQKLWSPQLPQHEKWIRCDLGHAKICSWWVLGAQFDFLPFSWKQNMLRFQWSGAYTGFLTCKKYCFRSVCLFKSQRHCRIISPFPMKGRRGSKKEAPALGFYVFAF